MAQSASLGEVREIALSNCRIRYRERGEGPAVLFVHGFVVNADLWRAVAPVVAAAGYRAIAPDFPLGAHEIPVPGADLSAPGIAAMAAEFIEKLGLDEVIVVANEFGGVVAQLLMTDHPDRVRASVLVDVDSFEYYPPPILAYLVPMAYVPGFVRVLASAVKIGFIRRLPIAFGWASQQPIPPEILDSNMAPARRNRAIRKDVHRFLRAVDTRHTLEAAQKLPRFEKPVSIVWAREDKIFPMRLGKRLHALLSNSTLHLVDDSYTWMPEDQPELLARSVIDFCDSVESARIPGSVRSS
jgi:pimeloyl-ACP methyl ester carboxylesterase